jgi:molybdate transport system substrate-binding protein
VVAAALALAGCGASGSNPSGVASLNYTVSPDDVLVAAASDLTFALDEIVEAYESANPGTNVEVTYGSSGNLATQIRNGAPFDIFLSADIDLARELADAGHGEATDVFAYAVGRLVVWAAHDSPADPALGLAGLTAPEVRTVAIANPAHAPYGRAAQEAMETAGVWEAVTPKLVMGENIAQAAEFALTANADAGVIALSLALTPQMQEAGAYSEVPLAAYPRMDQGGIVLADAPPAAHAFASFLQSDAGREILATYGFVPEQGQ